MATMKDVARLAGVSLGTVSNVLNGKESVLPENREKVNHAMKELGFQYNMMARALKTKKTRSIGLIITTIINPYFQELTKGVEDAAREDGFTVFLCNSDYDKNRELQYIEGLLSRSVDGLILVETKLTKDELLKLKEETALVLIDYESEVKNEFDIVNINDYDGIHKGLKYLTKQGHERIAFISGSTATLSSQRRIRAYKAFLKRESIPYRPEYIIEGDYSWKSGYRAAQQIQLLKERPTAVFSANDMMALGFIKAMVQGGLRIPEDYSVIGYDNIEMSSLSMPGLTTIDQPKYEVGRMAEHLLVKRLRGQTHQENQVIMETRVVERESVTGV